MVDLIDYNNLNSMPPLDYDQSKVPIEIKQRSEGVRRARGGKQNREFLAQNSEIAGLIADEAKQVAERTQTRQDNLEGQTANSVAQMEADKNTIIANATVDSEVILARGGRTTLGARLDETTSQLKRIVQIDVETFKTPTNTYQQAINLAMQEFDSGVNGFNQQRIIFPNKEITINETITLKSNLIIDLNGCILKKHNNADFHMFEDNAGTIENLTIMNGTLDGNSQGVTGVLNRRLVSLESGEEHKNVTIENVVFTNNKSYYVVIRKAVDVTVQNCKFLSNYDHHTVALMIYYPDIAGSKRIRILNNYVYGITGDNLVVGGTPEYKGSECIISGNIIEKPCGMSNGSIRLGAIQCEGGSAKASVGFENIIITDNIVKNLGSTGTNTDGIIVASGKNVIITNNICIETTYGIAVVQSENAHVTNNIVEKAQSFGIDFHSVGRFLNVSSNQVLATGTENTTLTSAMRYRLYNDENYNNSHVKIHNNYVYMAEGANLNSRGIYLYDELGLTEYNGKVVITGNEIANELGNKFSIRLEGKNFLTLTVENNEGWKTEAHGTGVIDTSRNIAVIEHGLSDSPTNIVVSLFGVSNNSIYVSDLNWGGGSQFRVKSELVAEEEIQFFWRAVVEY